MLLRQPAGFIKNKSKGLFNMKNIEELEKRQIQIKELFKEMVTEEFYDTWGGTFEIESIDEKQVIVTYTGHENIKEFKKQCNVTLVSCIYSILGYN